MDSNRTFVGHLEELRKRLIYTVIAVGFFSAAAFFYIEEIVELLVRPVPSLVFLTLTEGFMVRVNLAMYLGIFLSFPVAIYNTWAYVRPALFPAERRHLGWFIPLSYLLFIIGMAFCYYLVLPIGIKFLLSYETNSIKPMISFSSYVGFVSILLLAFGAVFQMPLVQVLLAKIGIMSPEQMRRQRRVAILVIFILAAMLTPGPDIFSQFMMAVPMMLLYEAGIILSVLICSDEPAGGDL